MCSSVEILKGYIVGERLGTPGLGPQVACAAYNPINSCVHANSKVQTFRYASLAINTAGVMGHFERDYHHGHVKDSYKLLGAHLCPKILLFFSSLT